MPPGWMRGSNGSLANKTFLSNPIEIIGDDINVVVDFHVSISPTVAKYSLRRMVFSRTVFSGL